MSGCRLDSEGFRRLLPHAIQRAYRNLYELYQRASKKKKIYQKNFRVSQEETRISSQGIVTLVLVGYKGRGETHDGKGSFSESKAREEKGVSFYEITAEALLKWDQKSKPGAMTLTNECKRAVTTMKRTTRGVKVERVFKELRFQYPDQDPDPVQLTRVGKCLIFTGKIDQLEIETVEEKSRPPY